nr:hypothetical protein BDDEJBFL_00065 [Agrobacterium fabrum]
MSLPAGATRSTDQHNRQKGRSTPLLQLMLPRGYVLDAGQISSQRYRKCFRRSHLQPAIDEATYASWRGSGD